MTPVVVVAVVAGVLYRSLDFCRWLPRNEPFAINYSNCRKAGNESLRRLMRLCRNGTAARNTKPFSWISSLKCGARPVLSHRILKALKGISAKHYYKLTINFISIQRISVMEGCMDGWCAASVYIRPDVIHFRFFLFSLIFALSLRHAGDGT